jgi:two-component system sensor histidine kinase UhpB
LVDSVKQRTNLKREQKLFKASPPVVQRLSLFEKVILTNSAMLVAEALAGLWVTSHNLETHHYFIDTSFIVLATLLGLVVNALLLRASFRPLFALLTTMRAISAGNTEARASVATSDAEIGALANTFNTMLDRLDAARHEQAMSILQAQEEERRRISLELHDESGQTLTALLVYVEVLNQRLNLLPEQSITRDARQQLEGDLSHLSELTQHSLQTIRSLAQQLRPSVLDDLGLPAALRWLAEDSRQRLQLSIEVHIEGIAEPSGHRHAAEYEIALFRTAQEGLTNIARHAHAQHVILALQQQAAYISLQVRDDGCGYDTTQQRAGLGIFGMRERVSALGGTFTIDSQCGKGTSVQVLIPLPVNKGKASLYD